MTDPDVVVLGAGVSAATLARELRTLGHDGRIILHGAEEYPPYDRPPLSKQLLAGKLNEREVALFGPGEAEQLGVELTLGSRAVSVDTNAHVVHTEGGGRQSYQILIIATGAQARRIPEFDQVDGVHYLRSMEDALRLAPRLQPATRVAIVGAGFIGLEVAAVAAGRGCHVRVIESAARPLSRVLGDEVGEILTDLHARNGVEICCLATVEGILGNGQVRAVVINGEPLVVDLLVVGVGAVVDAAWLGGSGVTVDDGVVCDASGRTNISGVLAMGDVSRWINARTGEHRRMEQWQSAVDQARVVAQVIADPQARHVWDSVPYFWSDQFGKKLQMCGVAGPDTYKRDTFRGPVVCFGRAGRLTGVLSINNTGVLAQGRRLVGSSWSEALTWANAMK